MAHEHVVDHALLGDLAGAYWWYLHDGALNTEKVLSPVEWLAWHLNGSGKAEENFLQQEIHNELRRTE